MPAIQALQNQSVTLEVVASSITSSATVNVYNPDGSSFFSLPFVATVDSTSATITAQDAASPETLTVNSVSGFVVNRPYVIASQNGQQSVLFLSQIDTSASKLIFDAAPPFAIENNDTINGARVSFDLPSNKTAERGLYFRAEFLIDPAASGADKYKKQVMFHICRTQFEDPVSMDDVKRVLSFQFPASADYYQAGQLREIAERASNMVMRQIEASGKMPHLLSSPDAFRDAGLLALRLCLADDNLIPQAGTTELIDYVDSIRKQMQDSISVAIKAGQWYDKNDDGKVEERETGAFSTKVML